MKKILLALALVASSGLSAKGANDHIECHAVQFYERLNVEIQQSATHVRVRLFSFDAGRAAQQLGLVPANVSAHSLSVDLPTAWCHASADKLGVVQCELPHWQWPRPTLTATALDRDGAEVGRGQLSVYQLDLERTQRISASSAGDRQRAQIELEVQLISEADNAKRAHLRLPYQPQNCVAK